MPFQKPELSSFDYHHVENLVRDFKKHPDEELKRNIVESVSLKSPKRQLGFCLVFSLWENYTDHPTARVLCVSAFLSNIFFA